MSEVAERLDLNHQLDNKHAIDSGDWQTYKVSILCPKCEERFLRSNKSSAWSCSKCRKYLGREIIRDAMYKGLKEAGFDVTPDDFKRKRGRPKKQEEEEVTEKKDKTDKKSKISPRYASEVKDTGIFDEPTKAAKEPKTLGDTQLDKPIEVKPVKSKLETVQEVATTVTVAKEAAGDLKEFADTLGITDMVKSVTGYFQKRREREEVEIEARLMELEYIEEEGKEGTISDNAGPPPAIG